MLKIIKKILISILILYMCISPLAQITNGVGNVQATATPTSAPVSTEITMEQVYTSQESQTTGFQYYIHVGNVTYANYYQYRGFYKNDYLYHSAVGGTTIKDSGCGYSSCANVLTGYGFNVTPRDTVKAMASSFTSNTQIATCMSKYGIAGQWISGRTRQGYKELIEKALSEGKPVIALMGANRGGDSFWTTTAHFIPIVGQDENYMWTCDPAPNGSIEKHIKYQGKLDGASKYMAGVWIPNEAPAGGNAGATYVPSEGGSNIPVDWDIGNEIPDLDELGDFRYKGNPKGMTYNGTVKPLEWVFNSIKNFINYILGMLFSVIKIGIVGTIENIESLINGTILKIEQIDEDIHYTIEDLVYNRIPLLDPNILSGTAGGMEIQSGSNLEKIRNLIAGWYVSFRNISVIIILIMLIYTGIRMALTMSAEGKANFKQQLFTWVKCMAMVFILHYVIFLVLNLNNTIVSLFDPSNNTAHENILYNTIKTRAYDLRLSVGFTGTVMYIILFMYWIRFLIIYIKRLLKIVLLVVTAPFVIARYAMDNASGKGKKAYKDWLHDFVTNVFIQSVHALEYTVLIGIAVDLGTNSIIGFIVALVFLSQILKFDEIVLSILKFDGEDTGKRIQPLKEPLHLRTYLNYQYAKTAIDLTGKAVKTVGNGVGAVGKFANDKIKGATKVDILGAVGKKKDAVLNKKDDILANTIGKLNEEKRELYQLRKTTREKDSNGNASKRAKQAKKTISTYKKEKKKRYKARRENFIGQNRVLSTILGVGKFTIGTALMTQNLTTGALMVGLSPKEIKEAIIEHDKRREEYEKNNKKIEELGDTVKAVNASNRFEDGIQASLAGMEEEKRNIAIKQLLALSSVNGNTAIIDDAINDYMKKRGIKIINTENIDTILDESFDTIDPNKVLTTTQREQLKEELKRNLKIKRENEWMSMEDAAKQAEAQGLDEKGRVIRQQEGTSDQKQRDSQTETKITAEETKTEQLTPEERIKKAQETYETHYTREEVANMFSQGIQKQMVSQENMKLASQVTQMQDINYKYMKQTKKKLTDPNKFIKEMRDRFK